MSPSLEVSDFPVNISYLPSSVPLPVGWLNHTHSYINLYFMCSLFYSLNSTPPLYFIYLKKIIDLSYIFVISDFLKCLA